MKEKLQIDNPVHYNAKHEKDKAIKALEVAKKIEKKVVFVKNGFSHDFKPKNKK